MEIRGQEEDKAHFLLHYEGGRTHTKKEGKELIEQPILKGKGGKIRLSKNCRRKKREGRDTYRELVA